MLAVLKLTAFASIAFAGAMTMSIVPAAAGTVSVGVEEAQARIGRPVTPGSVAGAARRLT